MIFRNKRGGAQRDYFAIILLLLAGFIVLIPFLLKLGPLSQSETSLATCRLSVDWISAGKIFETPISEAPLNLRDLNCATENIALKKDPEIIKTVLAQKLFECNWEYGEGKVDFVSSHIGGFDGFEDGDTQCFVCARINVEGATEEDTAKRLVTYQELIDYMKHHKPPKGGKSYYQYLYESESFSGQIPEPSSRHLETAIPIHETLNVMFAVTKGSKTRGWGGFLDRLDKIFLDPIESVSAGWNIITGYADETRSDLFIFGAKDAVKACTGRVLTFDPPVKKKKTKKDEGFSIGNVA